MLKCPVCESVRTRLFMHGIFDCEDTDVIECEECGLQFLYPIMTEEEEARYYDGYYNKQDSRRFKKTSLLDQQENSYRHYIDYIDVYEPLIENSNSILEIGCGTGGFLRFLSVYHPDKKFLATERCNENVSFVRKCFGNVVVVDDFLSLSGQRFDRIFALGVFEHLRDSSYFLSQMRDLLTKNGLLVLKVPNKNNVLVHNYDVSEFKKFMYMKQHYFTFTEGAFKILAKQANFDIVGFHYIQSWGIDNHLSWLRYRKSREFSQFSNLFSRETFRSYNQDLIKNKVTDTFMAVLASN